MAMEKSISKNKCVLNSFLHLSFLACAHIPSRRRSIVSIITMARMLLFAQEDDIEFLV
jgi:hypothetical protein